MPPRSKRSAPAAKASGPLSYGNGHYLRGPDGVWRYSRTGAPVPGAHDLQLGAELVMEAPELHPAQLLCVEQAAAFCSIKPGSLRNMVARGAAPAPVLHVGVAPVWTAGVLRAWLETRPGHGGRPPRDKL